jgi:hypothetical protein
VRIRSLRREGSEISEMLRLDEVERPTQEENEVGASFTDRRLVT